METNLPTPMTARAELLIYQRVTVYINVLHFHYCLVVTGTMEWIMTFQKQLGISSSQLTSCHIFQRGRSTTNRINSAE